MKAYDQPSSSDGRLTSLPKPKIGHSVADKYKASASGNGAAPAFGAKPAFGTQSVDSRKDKLVGGLSRDFGAENGKTPAQIWAEKGENTKQWPLMKKTNSSEKVDEPEEHHAADLAKNLKKRQILLAILLPCQLETYHQHHQHEKPQFHLTKRQRRKGRGRTSSSTIFAY